tara:strand:+ start:856 stop:1026 length:171 start_codon:yes stop_codon:yes gene_type:complete
MKKLFILFFLASCAAPVSNINHNKKILNFNDNLSFGDFNKLLIHYAVTSPYPNLNE